MEEIKKSCSNCKYSANIRFYNNIVSWNCLKTPFKTGECYGSNHNCFEKFYCSEWEDMFDIKDKQ